MMIKQKHGRVSSRVKGAKGPGVKAATHALRDGDEADADERGDAAAEGEGQPTDPSQEYIACFISLLILLSLSLYLPPSLPPSVSFLSLILSLSHTHTLSVSLSL